MSIDSSSSATTICPAHNGGFAASITPLSNVHNARHTSHIAKSYRQASTLFLTRRLPEALSTILPIVTPKTDTETGILIEAPPVARASKSNRVKVWSLYLTILNAIAELEPQEGKEMIGAEDYRIICTKVREGEIWEEVVRNGYHGLESDVDAEVVINLATLLLAHCGTQIINQRRLEVYLTGINSLMSLARRLDNVSQSPKPRHRYRSPVRGRGTDTPRDLNARIKILELYTLHVLLRNDEWEQAKEYISSSPLLDDERREAFIQALDSLREEQADINRQKQEEQRMYEERQRRETEDSKRQREENERRERQRLREERSRRAEEKPLSVTGSNRSLTWGSLSTWSGASNQESRASSMPSSWSSAPGPRDRSMYNGASHSSSSGSSKKPVDKACPFGLTGQAGMLAAQIKGVIDNLSQSLNMNVAVLLPVVACIIGVLVTFAKREVREKIKRIVSDGWAKVKATASMGAKVSSL